MAEQWLGNREPGLRKVRSLLLLFGRYWEGNELLNQ